VAFSSVLVGVLGVAALNTVGSSVRTWRITGDQYGGTAIAKQLMAEVLGQNYEDPDETPVYGHEASESQSPTSRGDFDDTDDFDDWSASPPQLKDGTDMTEYTGWTREVIVQKVDPQGMAVLPDGATDQMLRCVTVTVTDPSGKATTLVGHRANGGMLEQTAGADVTVVNWIGSELRLGSSDANSHTGTVVLNHAAQP